jgi:restriction endonuclease Mrr
VIKVPIGQDDKKKGLVASRTAAGRTGTPLQRENRHQTSEASVPRRKETIPRGQKKWTQLRITSRATNISKGGLSNNAKKRNKLLLDRDEQLLNKVDGELEALKTAEQDKPLVEHDTPDKDVSGLQVVS